MSDDKFLGVALGCIPRRLFVLIVAASFCLYGIASSCYAIVSAQLPGEAGTAAQLAQDRCVGHRCQDVLTCRGAREATFHMREVTLVVASTVFGCWGTIGAAHSHASELSWFASSLIGLAVLLASCVLLDGAYTMICQAYPLNVVDEAVLWNIPGIPVREAVKYEIRDAMVSYPVEFVNRLTELNVFAVYVVLEALAIAFLAYTAVQVLTLAHYVVHGTLGLGVNYDIRDWRERVLLFNGIADQAGYQSTGRTNAAST